MGNEHNNPVQLLFEAIYNDHRDEVILPLLDDIENYNPENRDGIATLLQRAIDLVGILPKELAADMGTTRFNISKWKRGLHSPLKATRVELKNLLWQKLIAILAPEDRLARALRAN